ncbi:GyrI-like domain-containing protein [Saccharibacillus sp. JS10]|uniref:GyrI-like domain-containing protein n=1 Tax=Saccharibacillus sp. JS10 TaxID=2950552 RepID=UPI00210EBB7E|nr:effector binding domain-containing protein [Saccharibacillus sp. JS10]MCQ4087935.1 effector binding domain-containing protein [Saccharibacillus sp. JS10]
MSLAHFLPDHEQRTFVHKPGFALTGFAIHTHRDPQNVCSGEISELWRSYYQSGLSLDYCIRRPYLIYALYTDYEASGAYTFVIGHETAVIDRTAPIPRRSFSTEESERFRAWVPSSKYRIFRTKKGKVSEVVAQTWDEIRSFYESSSERRAYTGDFEVYDTRDFDPEAAEVCIYIAIR